MRFLRALLTGLFTIFALLVGALVAVGGLAIYLGRCLRSRDANSVPRSRNVRERPRYAGDVIEISATAVPPERAAE